MIMTFVMSFFVILIGYNLSSGDSRLEHTVTTLYAPDSPAFKRTLGRLFGPPMIGGNRITALHNGDEIFPAMLNAIRNAKKTITFEIYIYWKGEIGGTFTEALCERARAGVKTHVLFDWLGSSDIDEEYITRMTEAGVEVERYRPLHWYNLDRMNNRSHRRLLVVDGKIGFTGGVGVGDNWLGNAEGPDRWRDSHFQLEGPAVGQMQAAFMLNWTKVRPTLLHGDDYFPALEPVGTSDAQVITSSASEGNEATRLMYMIAIASAEHEVLIANSYFVPDDLAIKQLIEARKRGVKIEIIVPGAKTDVPYTWHASRSFWKPLIEADIAIYEYEPTMYHTKVMIVDGIFVSVGSTNFDDRSFRLNDEANLNVIDRELAASETKTFLLDRTRSHRITLREWEDRSLKEKIVDKAAALFRSQL